MTKSSPHRHSWKELSRTLQKPFRALYGCAHCADTKIDFIDPNTEVPRNVGPA